ncbi:ORMDL family protein [Aspergillus nidulans FGSC A4]|uniref:Evolutionarily conserved protein with similarity to Orm2p (Eurofung) n=1 Tax=Emericella nidulans (strain FGSC A4 / ATCC 38163 / CBS 112.46 / NRRL 194 / M139) TaxID=227321 RepID=C8VKV5_EMENI|nr:hypothetical protein [Aspergillus nidulans FGSC A4]CBF85851.1 TPA: evolutionarily conserved protein with similarity to Orm2p (Eurofung) [Aspergillus nidulans FGSC A4]
MPRAISFPPEVDTGPHRLAPDHNMSQSKAGRRRRSSSIIYQEPPESIEHTSDQAALPNLNANWVNAKGAWTIHFVLIAALKIFYDILPGVSQETSWTLTNISYMFGSFLMFHWVRGIPFEFNAGAYDNLNMWEQIDNGDQYTPAKKFLLCVPICLFLLSTHYTHYDLTYFVINFLATLGVVLPKLPFVSSPTYRKSSGTASSSLSNVFSYRPYYFPAKLSFPLCFILSFTLYYSLLFSTFVITLIPTCSGAILLADLGGVYSPPLLFWARGKSMILRLGIRSPATRAKSHPQNQKRRKRIGDRRCLARAYTGQIFITDIPLFFPRQSSCCFFIAVLYLGVCAVCVTGLI